MRTNSCLPVWPTPSIRGDGETSARPANRPATKGSMSVRRSAQEIQAREQAREEERRRLARDPKTVGTYRGRLAQKMTLTTDAELTAYVFRHHLLE